MLDLHITSTQISGITAPARAFDTTAGASGGAAAGANVFAALLASRLGPQSVGTIVVAVLPPATETQLPPNPAYHGHGSDTTEPGTSALPQALPEITGYAARDARLEFTPGETTPPPDKTTLDAGTQVLMAMGVLQPQSAPRTFTVGTPVNTSGRVSAGTPGTFGNAGSLVAPDSADSAAPSSVRVEPAQAPYFATEANTPEQVAAPDRSGSAPALSRAAQDGDSNFEVLPDGWKGLLQPGSTNAASHAAKVSLLDQPLAPVAAGESGSPAAAAHLSAAHPATVQPTALQPSLAYATLPGQMGTALWREDFASRVSMLATQRVASAELRINPAELGPVQVSIRVDAGETSIVFSAQHADTRAALDSALPRLREMLEANGISVGNASVGPQFSGNGSAQTQSGAEAIAGAPEDAPADNPPASAMRSPVRPDQLVDIFA